MTVQLTTEHLRLTPVDLDRDTPYLHLAYRDPAVMGPWLDQDPTGSPEETRRRIADRGSLPGACQWSIRRRDEQEVLGLIELIGATAVPGLSWMLRQEYWGRGILGEAAPAVADHLLGPAGLAHVEAWVDSDNPASAGVARRAGLTERGRFAQAGRDGRPRETVIFGRSAEPASAVVYAVEVVLPVRDVDATVALLVAALGGHETYRHGEPTRRAGLRLGPWSTSPGVQVAHVVENAVAPCTLYVHCAAPVADRYARARDAGVNVVDEVQARPWGRTEFTFRLPEGHLVVVGGPG
ncbi:GNAT family N-acetyltransferase [Micromonospora lutea]|uniref:VOC domain-containing protein n=1 Tax=Micromonospora lutea TaxID=419825 RepID=A0ABQ4IT17_9ACTN|nr:GNAT family N-acetyltransferase [Micromonospora lutea]GIJ21072.1 hypothetical protein Vlu01_16960 [Micromonospora lutea]